jgi:mono/diheme cytochrome c family protein
VALASLASAQAPGKDAAPQDKIWAGVFTAAQADRGKAAYIGNCQSCHHVDLAGNGAGIPPLKGQAFISNWTGSANRLFGKIRDTMPANFPESINEGVKADVIAYLLQQNGFPAGATELPPDDKVFEDIQIVGKNGSGEAPNFSIVRVVGCLAQGGGNAWTLVKTSNPVFSKDGAPTETDLKEAAAQKLGTQTYVLVSVSKRYEPASHVGQKVAARGLIYRDGADQRLNLTALQTVGGSCD